VGIVQGGTQALSRSLFATMVPKTRTTEFFGFYSTGEKVAGIVGPTMYGLVGQLTGSSRWGIVSVSALFIAGAALLWCVNEREGRRVAEAGEDFAKLIPESCTAKGTGLGVHAADGIGESEPSHQIGAADGPFARTSLAASFGYGSGSLLLE